MTGLSALVRRETRELALLLHVYITRKSRGSIQQEVSHLQFRRGPFLDPDHMGTMSLDFSASTAVRSKFLLFLSHLVCNYFVIGT